jgi:hypothetical protein
MNIMERFIKVNLSSRSGISSDRLVNVAAIAAVVDCGNITEIHLKSGYVMKVTDCLEYVESEIRNLNYDN